MTDKQFAPGFLVKPPRDNAPSYVKASVFIKRDDFAQWLKDQGEWVNLNVKESKNGKWYAEVDTWKPQGNHSAQRVPENAAPAPAFDDDGFDSDKIPF